MSLIKTRFEIYLMTFDKRTEFIIEFYFKIKPLTDG